MCHFRFGSLFSLSSKIFPQTCILRSTRLDLFPGQIVISFIRNRRGEILLIFFSTDGFQTSLLHVSQVSLQPRSSRQLPVSANSFQTILSRSRTYLPRHRELHAAQPGNTIALVRSFRTEHQASFLPKKSQNHRVSSKSS